MKIKSSLIISLTMILCISCSDTNSPNKAVKIDKHLTATGEAAPKPDMKAMFGPNYQKGDIGHSKGIVTAVDANTGRITIDHGTLHGTLIEAAVSPFETLPSAKNIILTPNDQVEFLVKKGNDSTYRLLKICVFTAPETGCL